MASHVQIIASLPILQNPHLDQLPVVTDRPVTGMDTERTLVGLPIPADVTVQPLRDRNWPQAESGVAKLSVAA